MPIIFQTPAILIILALALAAFIISAFIKKGAGVFRVISVILVVSAVTYALVLGARLYASVIIVLTFLALNLAVFIWNGKGRSQ